MKIILATIFVLLSQNAMANTYNNRETPDFVVIKTDNNIEFREYQDFNISTNKNDSDEDVNLFGDLFSFIGGNNETKTKIDMTVPVLTDKNNPKETYMSFVVPSKFDLQNIPKPNNKNIVISKISLKTVLAIKFSGFVSHSNFAKHKDILLDYAEKNNIKIDQNSVISLIYDSPFTFPFNRRNEIIVKIIK